jgi:hypothetical protein
VVTFFVRDAFLQGSTSVLLLSLGAATLDDGIVETLENDDGIE